MSAIHKFLLSIFVFGSMCLLPGIAYAGDDDPSPPDEVTRLIFIHHSCGQNWLTDGHGDLGIALSENNYFVSDTNYGWGPGSIGDATDIVNWPDWFLGDDSERILSALYQESGRNSDYTRTLANPGGENRIVMFKSCFPNSNLDGNPDDPPTPGYDWTVGNAKYIYNQLLDYFITRPDKLFIVITAPPVQDKTYAANARAFNQWLVEDWLRENDYPLQNVAVWDFHNVLTHKNNHHRFVDGQVEYITGNGNGTLAYPSGRSDDHPNEKGNQKATEEFVPMLNIFYHRWINGDAAGVVEPPEESSSGELPTEEAETQENNGVTTTCPLAPALVIGVGMLGFWSNRRSRRYR